MIPEHIKKAAKVWSEGSLKQATSRSPERSERFETASGQAVERLYLPEEDQVAGYVEKLGFPGEYPFTRGIHPTMYRGRLWTMRQYAGFSTAEESNRRYRYLLDQGSTGLSVAFDLPTQIGLDSDDERCVGEVGKVGVAIDTLDDIEKLFEGIPLDQVSTSMTINAPAAILLAMYIAVAEKRGVMREKLSGTIQNDVLKEYIARGSYIFPPQPSLRIVSDIFAFCSREVPRWNTISISGYHIREAGATAVQEVAFTLANAIAYIETALAAGLSIDQFAPRLTFFFAAHTDLFEEVAKFRAARRLYARFMKERFGAKDPRSMMLRFHTQTGGVTLTAQQPDNNVVRVTLQALAAVLGGTQSLHTNSKDEALALPTEEAVTVALRTQQIIAHESGVTNTVDPLGGSYFLEHLTDQIEEGAVRYIREIDDLGGVVKAIECGYIQREIEESAYAYGRSVEEKRRIVVGVNEFRSDAEPEIELFEVPEEVRARQVERLESVRKRRDKRAVIKALDELRQAANDPRTNLMPPILKAVHAYASIGEICGVLREVFGEYQEMRQ
ncbi:MAG TPA: methylmalonyl-CoA mutase family protein [Acidobacteriota bacterium]|nr:methylmalonyl-CoA mutase family protein [Acidobacteriota bacterium]